MLHLNRRVAGAWAGTLSTAIITGLLYGLGLVLLFPVLGPGARVLSFPVVWYWSWRAGVLGGLVAGLGTDLVLGNRLWSLAELTTPGEPKPAIQAAFVVVNAATGLVVGRMFTLGRRLARELKARERAEVRLRESEECYRLLFERNPHPMWVSEARTLRFLALNEAALRHYGYAEADRDRLSLVDFLLPEDVPTVRAIFDDRVIAEGHFADRRHRRKDGTIIDVEVTMHRVAFRGHDARLILASDVTERKRAQAILEHQAHHDALTGLPNRTMLRRRIEAAIGGAGCPAGRFATFLLDLDRFKEINDTLGHTYGDLALRQIGPRLGAVLRGSDVLARLGGDEFGVFLPGLDGPEALRVADRLLKALREPFVLEGRAFEVGASLGIAIHPDHGGDVDTLLHRADVAMYEAKRSRGGAVLHGSGPLEPPRRGLEPAGDPRSEVEPGRLRLHAEGPTDGPRVAGRAPNGRMG